MPGPDQILLLLGTADFWAITAATRTGEVSVVAPFRSARLVFANLIVIAFFGEFSDAATLTGAALIIASGL